MNKNQSLLTAFIEFNRKNRLAGLKKKVLLTVSGGLDSIAMCQLFHEAKFPFSIAHCNFLLRGEESDADEKLVRDTAEKYGVQFWSKKFNTADFATQKNLSIQVAAREIRYAWFEELRKEYQFDLIATAHHLNDNIETILFNFTKGTGIRGLRGIPVKQGYIIRPLLFAQREQLVQYQQLHQLPYREDSSNSSLKYTRNKIRHQVIPLLKEINPSLENTLSGKIELLNQIEQLYERELKKTSKQLFLQRGEDIYIPILQVKKTKHAHSVLYEYLKDYDFTSTQVENMLDCVYEEAGKQFLTTKARIIKDRRFFILTRLADLRFSMQHVYDKDEELILGKHKLKVTKLNTIPNLKTDKQTAILDADKLEFPLIARPWKPGDYFYPFGMGMKKKKLKKFLHDEKVPLHEKEQIWVIESNKKIVWVVGYRSDERFKVTPHTTGAIKLSLS
ncbi:MAG: tRNA lysidine(34) synthetase TilS [Chitinophagales bacterium]